MVIENINITFNVSDYEICSEEIRDWLIENTNPDEDDLSLIEMRYDEGDLNSYFDDDHLYDMFKEYVETEIFREIKDLLIDYTINDIEIDVEL